MPGSVASAKLCSPREITRHGDPSNVSTMAVPNCLASWAKGSECCTDHERPCQPDQFVFRRRFTDHSPGHSAAIRREEIARARARNGSGDKEFQKAKDE